MVTHKSLSCIIVLRRTHHHLTYNIYTLFPLSPLTSASVLLTAVLPVPGAAMDSCSKNEECKNCKENEEAILSMPGELIDFLRTTVLKTILGE